MNLSLTVSPTDGVRTLVVVTCSLGLPTPS